MIAGIVPGFLKTDTISIFLFYESQWSYPVSFGKSDKKKGKKRACFRRNGIVPLELNLSCFFYHSSVLRKFDVLCIRIQRAPCMPSSPCSVFPLNPCTPFGTFIFVSFSLSLPPSRNSKPGSHIRLFSPSPKRLVPSIFFSREAASPFFPRRPASNCTPTRAVVGALSSSSFLFYFCKVNSTCHQ